MKYFKFNLIIFFSIILFSAIFFNHDVLASNVNFINQPNLSTGVNQSGFTEGHNCQSITATQNNISRVGIWNVTEIGDSQNIASTSATICNISGTTSHDCLDSPVYSDNTIDKFNATSTAYNYFNFSNYPTTPDNYYLICLPSTNSGYLTIWVNTPDNYGGGQFIDNSSYDYTFAVDYDDEYIAEYIPTEPYYISNSATSTGISIISSADQTVYTARMHSCKSADDIGTGQVGIAVWDSVNDEYIATSTLKYLSDFEYYSDMSLCLNAMTYDFLNGFNMVEDGIYQFQLWTIDADPGTGIGFATSDEENSYYVIEGTDYGEFDYTDDYAIILDLGASEYYTTHTAQGDIFWNVDQVSAESFMFPPTINCLVASSTACNIKIQYSVDDIGASVYLLDKDDYFPGDAVDSILALGDNTLLADTLTPLTRSSEQIDTYQFYVDRTTYTYIEIHGAVASSSLYQYTKVNWVNEITDELERDNKLWEIWGYIKNIFPLSIGFQLADVVKNVYSNTQEIEPLNFKLADFVADDYKTIASTSINLIGAENLQDNLGTLWSEKIYGFMEIIIYLVNFIFILFLILPGKQSVNDEGL